MVGGGLKANYGGTSTRPSQAIYFHEPLESMQKENVSPAANTVLEYKP
jgi:hypothetical protein